jgi:hypothetical protein
MSKGIITGVTSGVPAPQLTMATGQGMPITSMTKKPKHTMPYPERFMGKDESLYPIFRGLLEAKLQTNAQAIGREYKQV